MRKPVWQSPEILRVLLGGLLWSFSANGRVDWWEEHDGRAMTLPWVAAPPGSYQRSAESRGRTTAPPCWPASSHLQEKREKDFIQMSFSSNLVVTGRRKKKSIMKEKSSSDAVIEPKDNGANTFCNSHCRTNRSFQPVCLEAEPEGLSFSATNKGAQNGLFVWDKQ